LGELQAVDIAVLQTGPSVRSLMAVKAPNTYWRSLLQYACAPISPHTLSAQTVTRAQESRISYNTAAQTAPLLRKNVGDYATVHKSFSTTLGPYNAPPSPVMTTRAPCSPMMTHRVITPAPSVKRQSSFLTPVLPSIMKAASPGKRAVPPIVFADSEVVAFGLPTKTAPVSPMITSASPVMTAASPLMTPMASPRSSIAYDGVPTSATDGLLQIEAKPLSTVHPSFCMAPLSAVPSLGAVHPSFGMPPQKLAVSILQAHGLQHTNNFMGSHPYCICEAVHSDGHTGSTKIETKRVTEGDLLNPFWGETHYLESWYPGEALQFTVLDEGFVGSKIAGQVRLPSELFFPQGFGGMLQVAGLPNALLHVIVRPLGTSAAALTNDTGDMSALLVQGAPQSGKREKRLKVNEKPRACC